jgi:hypothetical protein
VQPAFERLQERLRDYAPEDAAPICNVHPDTIRKLARKVASRKTHVISGWTLGKSYHGDLMERSICLLLALTGNWGKQGAGIRSWAVGMFDGPFLLQLSQGLARAPRAKCSTVRRPCWTECSQATQHSHLRF